jgi:glycosyltransferase involved in cell wall biosynthesis
VGRLQGRKNLPQLVEAFAALRKQGATSKLVLVGKKDWQAEQLEARIRELGLEADVIFPGFVSFEDLPLFYNAAEMFVFPSFFEGFGLPVIESMASGVPTITSTTTSLGEVAGDGAIMVDPNDTQALTRAMASVLGSVDLQKDLITRGLLRAAQFSHGELARKVLDVYGSFS